MGFLENSPHWLVVVSSWLLIWFLFDITLKSLFRTPMRKLRFIEKAHKNDAVTMGKMSSYIVYGNPTIHEVEYIYEVNGKVHFITYKLQRTTEKYNDMDEMQPGDAIAMFIPTMVPVYYDRTFPKKAVIRGEVFSSRKCMKQIRTKKTNRFRDIYKDWTEPVVL